MINKLIMIAIVSRCFALNINYLRLPSTHSTPLKVVYIHGLGDDYRSWLDIALNRRISSISEAYLVTLRNHSDSPWAESMTYSELAGDIHETLKLDNYVAVGHSIGCKVANTLAMNYPENVRGVVCGDSYPLDLGDIADPEIFEMIVNMLEAQLSIDLSQSLENIHKEIESKIANKEMAKAAKEELIRKNGNYVWKNNIEAIHDNFKEISGYEAGTIYCPYMSLNGEKSLHFDFNKYKEICPEYTIERDQVTISGAEHYIQVDNYPETVAALLKFFNRIK